jgi:small subunit ribosomal protein S20
MLYIYKALVLSDECHDPTAVRVVAGVICVANIKSAIKRVKIAERNRLRNKAYKSTVKTLIKKCLLAVQAGDVAQGEVALRFAYSKIDKAVKRGVLHPNNGARKKARLARKLKQLEAQAQTVAPSA